MNIDESDHSFPHDAHDVLKSPVEQETYERAVTFSRDLLVELK
jgi:hypothetical protein